MTGDFHSCCPPNPHHLHYVKELEASSVPTEKVELMPVSNVVKAVFFSDVNYAARISNLNLIRRRELNSELLQVLVVFDIFGYSVADDLRAILAILLGPFREKLVVALRSLFLDGISYLVLSQSWRKHIAERESLRNE